MFRRGRGDGDDPCKERGGDVYVAATFSAILAEIRRQVESDSLVIGLRHDQYPASPSPSSITRSALCDELVRRFFDEKSKHMALHNAEFVGMQPSDRDPLLAKVKEALASPAGFAAETSDRSGWAHWQGTHRGYWCDHDLTGHDPFSDEAHWARPRRVREDGAVKIEQRVEWPERPCRSSQRGWNRSLAGTPYVWGWDPKQQGDRGCNNATTVGFPWRFASADGGRRYAGIVWVTPMEVFLECVRLDGESTFARVGGRPGTGYAPAAAGASRWSLRKGRAKTSTKYIDPTHMADQYTWGWGQWLIGRRWCAWR